MYSVRTNVKAKALEVHWNIEQTTMTMSFTVTSKFNPQSTEVLTHDELPFLRSFGTSPGPRYTVELEANLISQDHVDSIRFRERAGRAGFC